MRMSNIADISSDRRLAEMGALQARHRITWQPNGALAFLFPIVFLFFGPSMPPLVAVYGLVLWGVLLYRGRLQTHWVHIVGVLAAALLEIIYRYRVDGAPGVGGLARTALVTIAAFLGAFLAANISDFAGRHRGAFLAGNYVVIALIILQRVLGQYLAPTHYDFSFSPERAVGPGLPDPNIFALTHIAFLFPLMVSNRLKKLETRLLLLLMIAIPLYSLSRTALAVLAVLFMFGFPRSWRIGGVQKVLAGAAIIVLGLAYGEAVIAKGKSRLDVGTSVGARVLYAQLGIETLREELTVLGVPDREHLKVHQLSLRVQPSYHNTYISLIAASGIIAVIGLIVIYVSMGIRYRRREFLGLIAVVNALYLTTGALIGVGYPVMVGARREE